MADDPLRELLTSPLDDAREKTPRPDRPPRSLTLPGGSWLIAGLVVGALAVLGGYLVGADDSPAETSAVTTAAPTSTTTTLPPTAPVALPPGYVSADDGRLGIRVERILMRPDGTFVTVSTVVPSGIDGEQSSGFEGGAWELELTGGQVLSSTEEAEDPASPGFVTVRFEPGEYGSADLTVLRMVGNGIRMGDTVSTTSAGTFTIPADGSEVTVPLTVDSFLLDAGVTLALPEAVIGADLGRLTWELEGSETGALATVNPQLVITENATGTEIPTRAHGDFGGFVFLSPGNTFFQDVPMTRDGEVGYTHQEAGETFPTGAELSASIEIGVSWIVYVPTDAEIPIDANVEVAVVE